MITIELTRQELDALTQLVAQVQIRAVAPDSVEQASLFRNLGRKLVETAAQANGNLSLDEQLRTARGQQQEESSVS